MDKRRRGEEEKEEADGGIQNQKQEPHTKMRGIKKGRAKYSLNTHLSLPT